MKESNLKVLFISLITVMFLVGCSMNNEVSENTDEGRKEGTEVYDETKISLESWIGDYAFSEFVEPNINMFYSITIYETDGSFYADISIDGFQRLERVKANVKGDGELIEISFLEYLPDNLMELYEEDDTLLILEKKDSNIFTSWGAIQPVSPDNKEVGIYLVEVEE